MIIMEENQKKWKEDDENFRKNEEKRIRMMKETYDSRRLELIRKSAIFFHFFRVIFKDFPNF